MSDHRIMDAYERSVCQECGQPRNAEAEVERLGRVVERLDASNAFFAEANQRAGQAHADALAEVERLRAKVELLQKASGASDELLGLLEAGATAQAEAERLREREAHFARVLSVTDGGQYRHDWDSKLTGLVAEVERLREALEFCRDTSDDEERARVANAALVASGEQA